MGIEYFFEQYNNLNEIISFDIIELFTFFTTQKSIIYLIFYT